MDGLTSTAVTTGTSLLSLQGLIRTAAVAELALALACFSVTYMLLHATKRCANIRYSQCGMILAVVIFLFGASRLSLLSSGNPLQMVGLGIDIFAAIGCIVAALLVRRMTRDQAAESLAPLQGVIARLESELIERSDAEQALRQAHAELEARVQERTTDLYNRNQQLYSEIVEHNRVEAALRETQLVLDSAHRLALSNAGFDRHKISADLLALLAENHPFPTSAMLREDRRTGRFRCIAWHGTACPTTA